MSSADNVDLGEENQQFVDLRKQKVPSDFTIKVGEKSFLVHRETLIARSEYFQAMLSHETAEMQQGVADMKNVSVIGVGECVEFMYTGEVKMKLETVEEILHTADMIQLTQVKEKCVEFLDAILNASNCVSTLNLASKYYCPDLQKKAEEIFKQHFEIDLTELLKLEVEEFSEYLENQYLDNEAAWDGIVNWIKYKMKERCGFVFDLVQLLDWDEFPSATLLQRLWSQITFKDSPPCRKVLFENLFLDVELFCKNLCAENYFILETIAQEFDFVVKQIKVASTLFFERNVVALSQKDDFKYLSPGIISSLFFDKKEYIFAPEIWWLNTAISWIKHDPASREKFFHGFLKTIRFDRLPREYVENLIKNEPMVKHSERSFRIVVNALYDQINHGEAELIVLLYSDGRIRSFDNRRDYDKWSVLPDAPKPVGNAKIFYFNGKLCLVNDSNLYYLHNDQWIEKIPNLDISGSKQICTYDDFIIVFCGERLLCYNSVKDIWYERSPSPDFESVDSAAVLGNTFYVFNGCNIQKFHPIKGIWEDVSNSLMLYADSAVTIGKYIYTTARGSSYVNRFDPDGGHIRLSLYGSHTPSGILYFEGKIVVVTSKTFYAYDETCRVWNELGNIPQYVTGDTKGSQRDVGVISACVLSEDEKVYNVPPEKRQKLR